MSLSRWVEGGNSDHVTVLKWDKGLVGYCRIPAWQWAKLPRYWRERAVEVRPFPAPHPNMETQGTPGEETKGNPTTTQPPGAVAANPSIRKRRTLTRPCTQPHNHST